LIIIGIITPEGNMHFLLFRPHKHFDHKLDELVMVDPLITIGIDLIDNSLSNELRQIQVVLCPFNG